MTHLAIEGTVGGRETGAGPVGAKASNICVFPTDQPVVNICTVPFRTSRKAPFFKKTTYRQCSEPGGVLCAVECAVSLESPVAPPLVRRQAVAWRKKQLLSSPNPLFIPSHKKERQENWKLYRELLFYSLFFATSL